MINNIDSYRSNEINANDNYVMYIIITNQIIYSRRYIKYLHMYMLSLHAQAY